MTTVDVDVVHSQSPENITRLLSFLKSLDAVHRRLDDKLIEPKERNLSGKGHGLEEAKKTAATRNCQTRA